MMSLNQHPVWSAVLEHLKAHRARLLVELLQEGELAPYLDRVAERVLEQKHRLEEHARLRSAQAELQALEELLEPPPEPEAALSPAELARVEKWADQESLKGQTT